MSGKLMLKLDAISHILTNHTSANFQFLDHPDNGRNRTVFYTTLGKLLFSDDSTTRFRSFVAPIQQASRRRSVGYNHAA